MSCSSFDDSDDNSVLEDEGIGRMAPIAEIVVSRDETQVQERTNEEDEGDDAVHDIILQLPRMDDAGSVSSNDASTTSKKRERETGFNRQETLPNTNNQCTCRCSCGALEANSEHSTQLPTGIRENPYPGQRKLDHEANDTSTSRTSLESLASNTDHSSSYLVGAVAVSSSLHHATEENPTVPPFATVAPEYPFTAVTPDEENLVEARLVEEDSTVSLTRHCPTWLKNLRNALLCAVTLVAIALAAAMAYNSEKQKASPTRDSFRSPPDVTSRLWLLKSCKHTQRLFKWGQLSGALQDPTWVIPLPFPRLTELK